MQRSFKRVPKERPSSITVNVIRSAETVDIDAWCERYVADCLAVLRLDRQMGEAA